MNITNSLESLQFVIFGKLVLDSETRICYDRYITKTTAQLNITDLATKGVHMH